MRFLLPALLVALAACQPSATSACRDLCVELVSNCAYAAFPSIESCEQGCEYNASLGADVEAELTCITDAACDTFAIIECEHAYGVATDPGTGAATTP